VFLPAERTIEAVSGVFVPGWGAVPGLYSKGLPAGWEVLDLPRFGPTGGKLSAYRRWLDEEISAREGPISLAGHSMGGALAILAALDRPEAVERLILLSPAGLPLTRPLVASLVTYLGQIARGWYPRAELYQSLTGVVRTPRSALGLARAVRALDLGPECGRFRDLPVPCTVVGCSTDRLTTPDHCRRLAAQLGAEYREVDAPGGHIWMIVDPKLLSAALAATYRRKPDP
jgi:pimeloyl-ACP methyl ester carboxylesterase